MAHGNAVDPLAPAIAHREAGRYAEAATWLAEYLIGRPNDAGALAHLAHTRLLSRQDAAAEQALARAETLAPDSPLVLRNRARLALKAGKIDAAAQAVARALIVDAADRESRLISAAVLTSTVGFLRPAVSGIVRDLARPSPPLNIVINVSQQS